MKDVEIPPHRVQDPWELNVPGLGLGRDPVRTPMLWSDAPHAGFSAVEPWLPLSNDWREIHVDRQSALPNSLLSLYRALLALRRQEEALWRGDYVPISATDTLLVYERRVESGRLLVILNLSKSWRRVDHAAWHNHSDYRPRWDQPASRWCVGDLAQRRVDHPLELARRIWSSSFSIASAAAPQRASPTNLNLRIAETLRCKNQPDEDEMDNATKASGKSEDQAERLKQKAGGSCRGRAGKVRRSL